MTDIGPDGSSVQETATSEGLMNPALKAGLGVLDANATLNFTLYKRVVLPVDGFVFWVRADILSPSALVNSTVVNRWTANQARVIQTPAPVMAVPGSLHHTTLNQQDQAESFSLQQFRFSTPQPVDVLTAIQPDELWIGDWKTLRLAFSSRSGFYEQAGMFHYAGDALYPALATQVIDSPDQLLSRQVVVSNSLPIWLKLATLFPVFPSFLVPDNIRPPYAAIHIGEDDTYPMQSAPWHDSTGTRWQLVRDTVRVTTYGVRNDTFMDWLDLVTQYTLDNPGIMGIMNSPVPRDAKRGQTEFGIIAQKKVITFEADYYQTRVRDVARQLIKEAFIKVYPGAQPPGPYNPILPPGVFIIGYGAIGINYIGSDFGPTGDYRLVDDGGDYRVADDGDYRVWE